MVRANIKGVFSTYKALKDGTRGPIGITVKPASDSTAILVHQNSLPILPLLRS